MPDYAEFTLPYLLNRHDPLVNGAGDFVLPDYKGYGLSSIPAMVSTLLGGPPLQTSILAPQISEHLGRSYQNVIFILVDALGYDHFLRLMAQGYANFWQEYLPQASLFPLSSVCPSTTATALTTLWTGTEPSTHGYIGYEMWLKEYSMTINSILHSPTSFIGDNGGLQRAGFNPEQFLSISTIGELFTKVGIESHAFLPYTIGNSGLSRMHLEQTKLHGYVAESDLWVNLRDLLSQRCGNPRFLYVYWPTLDTLIHRYGPDDMRVTAHFADFSRTLAENFLSELDHSAWESTLLLLTADHGAVATPPDENYNLNAHPELNQMLRMLPTCESRLPFLFLKPGTETAVREYFAQAWPGEFTLITGEEAIAAQLFGQRPEHPALLDRVGDLVALPYNNAYLWWPNHINQMQGRHGGLSRLEMLVPLYALPLDELRH
jgi:hypothetical protein